MGKFTLTESRISGHCSSALCKGTYIAVEPFHLDRYVDEQVFRFNNSGNQRQSLERCRPLHWRCRRLSGSG